MTVATTATPPPLLPTRALAAYALAWAGGCIAYTPFLTVLLPQRLTVIAGNDDLHWLGVAATAGALAVKVGNPAPGGGISAPVTFTVD